VLALEGAHSILGRGLVVHERADDFSQPVGNAGGRVAFAVIGVANPSAD
jgi:Cu-Zn family superoxide dismutase